MQPHRHDFIIDAPFAKVLTYRRGETVNIPIKRLFDRVELDADVTKVLVPKCTVPNVLNGHLCSLCTRLKCDRVWPSRL